MTTKVHGVSLHFYDPGMGLSGSDKFYRAFIWATQNANGGTFWNAAYHWGRDGAPTGQFKHETYTDRADAMHAIEKKVTEKVRKGYEFLGQGELEVRSISDVAEVGHEVHRKLGHTPTKVGGGFSLIIQEEADLLELLTR